MGYLNINSGLIQDFTIEEITEENGYEVLHVTVYTDLKTHKYRVSNDRQEPDLKKIASDIDNGLSQAKNGDLNFGINEYEERMYILIKLPNNEVKQYTGSRIEPI